MRQRSVLARRMTHSVKTVYDRDGLRPWRGDQVGALG
jgi:hypothetical protein